MVPKPALNRGRLLMAGRARALANSASWKSALRWSRAVTKVATSSDVGTIFVWLLNYTFLVLWFHSQLPARVKAHSTCRELARSTVHESIEDDE